MSKTNLLTKLLLLCLCVVGSVNVSWAQTTLFTTDFTTTDGWTSGNITASSSEIASWTIKGTTLTYRSNSATNYLTVDTSNGGSLKFAGSSNPSASAGSVTKTNPNLTLGISLTGVNGSVTVELPGSTNPFYYTYDDGNTGTVVARQSAPSGSNTQFTIHGLTNSNVTIYIGRSNTTITGLTIKTPEKTALSESKFYSTYLEGDKTASELTENLPSYIFTTVTSRDKTSGCSSEITTPHDFSALSSSTTYSRLKTGNTNTITIAAISRVKSIRLYGNGNGGAREVTVGVQKISGTGSAMTVTKLSMPSSAKTVAEYSTGDLTQLSGYNRDTYYTYSFTFNGTCDIWGIYFEYAPPSSFTVTYNANGGSGEIANSTGASITLSNGTDFTAPSGYSFAGWNTAADGSGTAYTASQSGITTDLNLYAQWSQAVTLDKNGGTKDGSVTAYYNGAALGSVTAPTWADHAVTGYYNDDSYTTKILNADGSYADTDITGYITSSKWTKTGSTTLYPKWLASHSVTVEVNNALYGSAEATDDEVAEGETTTITATANENCKFVDWSVSGTGSSLSSTTDNPTTLTMGTADVTVTATFRALNTYTISYDKGTGEGITGSKDAETKTEDVAFTLPSTAVFSRTGYVQTGWATEDSGAKKYELGGSYTTNAAQTFYPVWTAVYTVTYSAGAGSGTVPTETSKSEGATFTLAGQSSMVAPTGKYFVGWHDGTANYAAGDTYTMGASNVTLTAQWATSAEANHYHYSYKDATHFNGTTYTNPLGGEATGKDGVELADENLCESLGGITRVTINSALYDNKSNHMNAYLKIAKGGSTSKVTITIADGYAGTLKLKAGGYSNNPTISVSSSTLLSGTVGGVATTEDNFNELVYDLTAGAHDITCTGQNMYISEMDLVTFSSVSGTITTTGWNTFSSNYPLDLSKISGGAAYYAHSVAGTDVVLKPTTGVVPAGEGLMIKGTPNDPFTIDIADTDGTTIGDNKLVGLPNGGTVAKNAHNYVFGWATDDPTTYGFYLVNDTEPTLGLGKAYLSLDADIPTGGRLNIVFDDEETTGIKAIDNEQLTIDNYFDLQGRKVAEPTKGLYIVNGKKVVIK